MHNYCMHLLPLADIANNNYVHASTDVMLFYAEVGFHPTVKATVKAILANRSVLDMPDV